MAADGSRHWSEIAARLLPVASQEDTLAPANLRALEAYWGESRLLRPAAVLVGLIERREGLHVLLTRRHDQLTQHAGQISFPGGRIDPDDRGAVHAALRETHEETGIPPSRVQVLGRSDAIATISQYRVEPVIARIDPDYELNLQPGEVSAAFELPLARAARDELWQPYPVQRPGLDIVMKALDFQGHTIWGATAMILERLLVRLHGLPL